MKSTLTLDEALAAEKRAGGVPCATCHSPNRKWIEKNRSAGASYRALSRALATAASERICDGAIRNHFDHGHHLNGNKAR